MKWVRHIRTQPVAKQKRFALIISGVLTVTIFVFWFIGWRELETLRSTDPQAEMHPFETMADVIGSGYRSLQEQIASPSTGWNQLGDSLLQMASTSFATTTDINGTTTAATGSSTAVTSSLATTSAPSTTDATE